MGDLEGKNGAMAVAITGADSDGQETFFINSDTYGSMFVALRDKNGNTLTSQANGLAQRALDVGICVAGVQIDPRQIRALTSVDVVTVLQGAGSSPWVISGTVIANEDKNYGAVGANTLRTAAQIGNATGVANFGAGATGAQTLRTESNQGAPNTAANAWPVKITDGTNIASVSVNSNLQTSDVLNNGGVDGLVALTTSAVEIKVGASIKTNRKFIMIQGKSNNIVWGLSNTTQSFTIANGQFIMLPFAPGSSIWARTTTGNGSIAVGEVS